MRRINKYLGSFAIAVSLVTIVPGCKKYLDVNQNLNDPTSVPISTLMTAVEQRIGATFAIGTTLGTGLGVYTHQLMQYGGLNRYGLVGPDMDGTWSSMYTTATNLDVMIDQASSEGKSVYSGIGKVLKAYLFSMMVDIWGNLPYTEFNQFKAGIKQPKFDDGSDIYDACFSLLDQGISDLNNTAGQVIPGNDDIVYKGNATLWKKAANTLKLKLYTQVRLVRNVGTQVQALLSNPAGLINSQAESFMFPFGPNGATDDRYPGYGDYNAAQRGGQVPSPWMYEIMKGYNPNILEANEDPRIPFYFYNQLSATRATENCADYRDGAFMSLTFGSNSPCVGGSNSNSYTLLGIYPIGGRYDDGSAKTINEIGAATAGTGAAPQRALTYADRLYLEAELIHVGLATGDERAVFSKALDESFNQVEYVIRNFIKPSQSVPNITTLPATTTYKTSVLSEFDAASPDKKLELIMTEKWLSRLGNSVDNYTDYRRTKYPILFNPAPANGGTTTSIVVPGPAGPNATSPYIEPVSNGTEYPWSLPYSQAEIEQNTNAPAQKVVSTFKVFWQP
ncbi:MAG: SusD/RagB family nutrient-binding outer membrane lipoprotein [Chitinophagales bacterium]|nr:SusD/RagB family nutrient-binding outer membrane lipoprotein [Chitinophagales bacterium]